MRMFSENVRSWGQSRVYWCILGPGIALGNMCAPFDDGFGSQNIFVFYTFSTNKENQKVETMYTQKYNLLATGQSPCGQCLFHPCLVLLGCPTCGHCRLVTLSTEGAARCHAL